MSKMQMLLFAVGIAVVALMFYDFVSRVGLVDSSKNLAVGNTKLIEEQLTNDLLCSFKLATIPDYLVYGFNSQRFFYDLDFATQTVGEGDNIQNTLILSVIEHKSSSKTKNIVYSKSIPSNSNFVLISPQFLLEGSGLKASYDQPEIALYPRAASTKEIQASSPNSFIALKETLLGKKTLYIIPCSSLKEPNNCLRNVLRVGCYKLKIAETPPTASTLVSSCFNVAVQASESSEKTKNYTWADCQTFFPEVTGEAS